MKLISLKNRFNVLMFSSFLLSMSFLSCSSQSAENDNVEGAPQTEISKYPEGRVALDSTTHGAGTRVVQSNSQLDQGQNARTVFVEKTTSFNKPVAEPFSRAVYGQHVQQDAGMQKRVLEALDAMCTRIHDTSYVNTPDQLTALTKTTLKTIVPTVQDFEAIIQDEPTTLSVLSSTVQELANIMYQLRATDCPQDQVRDVLMERFKPRSADEARDRKTVHTFMGRAFSRMKYDLAEQYLSEKQLNNAASYRPYSGFVRMNKFGSESVDYYDTSLWDIENIQNHRVPDSLSIHR